MQLSPDSPSVRLDMMIPRHVLDAVDSAAAGEGVTRSSWIRDALMQRLGDKPVPPTASTKVKIRGR